MPPIIVYESVARAEAGTYGVRCVRVSPGGQTVVVGSAGFFIALRRRSPEWQQQWPQAGIVRLYAIVVVLVFVDQSGKQQHGWRTHG